MRPSSITGRWRIRRRVIRPCASSTLVCGVTVMAGAVIISLTDALTNAGFLLGEAVHYVAFRTDPHHHALTRYRDGADPLAGQHRYHLADGCFCVAANNIGAVTAGNGLRYIHIEASCSQNRVLHELLTPPNRGAKRGKFRRASLRLTAILRNKRRDDTRISARRC